MLGLKILRIEYIEDNASGENNVIYKSPEK